MGALEATMWTLKPWYARNASQALGRRKTSNPAKRKRVAHSPLRVPGQSEASDETIALVHRARVVQAEQADIRKRSRKRRATGFFCLAVGLQPRSAPRPSTAASRSAVVLQ